MKKAYMLLADGFEEVEALGALDVLRRGGVDIKTVGITGKAVTGAHGVTVTADLLPSEADGEIALLVLPGGMPGTSNLDASPETDRLLAATLASGGHVGAICAAPSILGKRGLLRGREAVCYPGFEQTLSGASIPLRRVVTSDCFTTAVGMGAALDFGLELLRILSDEDTVRQVAGSAFILC